MTDTGNLKVKVSLDLPFCLYVPDNDYEIQMPSYKAVLRTTKMKHEHIDKRLFIEHAENMELRHDRHGRIHFTAIEVSLPAQAVIEQEIRRRVMQGGIQTENGRVNVKITSQELNDNYSAPAFEMAFETTNHFVAIYRQVTHGFYVKRISKDEVYLSNINWYDGDELLGGNLRSSFGTSGMTLMPLITSELECELRTLLSEYHEPSLILQLSLDAYDYMDSGNYRMAVIESRTCIEVLADSILLDGLTRKGKTIEEAKAILGVPKPVACKTLSELIQQAHINNKLKKGFLEVIGESLATNNDLWERWLQAKKNREDAVHSAVMTSENEAKEAIDTMCDIINFAFSRLNRV